MITTAGRVPGGVRDRVPAGVAGRVPGGVLARVAGYVPGGMAGRVAGGVAATVAVADAVLAGSGRRRARWLTKPALVPAIALATGVRPSGPAAVALAGSWAGDVALLSRSEAGLLGGIGGFAVAHAAYLKAIRALPPGPRSAGPGPATAGPATAGPATAGPAAPGPAGVGPAGASPGARGPGVESVVGAVVWAAAGHVLWRRLDTEAERRLRLPVLGYAALVTTMGAAAVRSGRRRGDPRLAAGGALFVVSDGLVAASLFGRRRPAVDSAVMLTYAAAQALLARALVE